MLYAGSYLPETRFLGHAAQAASGMPGAVRKSGAPARAKLHQESRCYSISRVYTGQFHTRQQLVTITESPISVDRISNYVSSHMNASARTNKGRGYIRNRLSSSISGMAGSLYHDSDASDVRIAFSQAHGEDYIIG